MKEKENPSPDENKFLEVQYATLRKEIEDAKGRGFKILAGEAFAIPLAQFLVGITASKDAGFLQIILPFLILILVLRFIYENNSIIRCGRYIRYYIEPFYIKKYSQDLSGLKINDGCGFTWTKKPGIYDKRLKDFLGKNYNIDWIYTARIAKSENGKTISISKEDKTLSLMLNNEASEVILKIDNVETDKFRAKEENGNLNIYNDIYIGWENWLECANNRQAERIMKESFYLLSAIYYIFSVTIAEKFVEDNYDIITFWGHDIHDVSFLSLVLYVIFGIVILFTIFKFVLTSTDNPGMAKWIRIRKIIGLLNVRERYSKRLQEKG